MSNLQKIDTPMAPRAVGPYSQAIRYESLIFVSGQVPINPETGELVAGDIKILTRQVIDNIEAILKEAGSSLDKVVRCDVFLTDLKRDFSQMNEEYGKRFKGAPARQTIQVSALPLGASVEISCIAAV